MKRMLVAIAAMVLVPAVAVLAQVSSSVESTATYGLFDNALDAAATIDESVTDLNFGDIGKEYLFLGVAGNPQKLGNSSFSASLVGGYYAPGTTPWSLFGVLDLSAADATGSGVIDTAGGTLYARRYRVFDVLSTRLQYLTGFGDFSAGLGLYVNLDDNLNPANNYTVSGTINVLGTDVPISGTVSTTDMVRNYALNLPFYMEIGSMSHYANIAFGLRATDKSANSDMTIDGVNAKSTTSDVLYVSSPDLYYKIGLPLDGATNLFASAQIGMDFSGHTITYTESTTPANNYVTTNTFVPGFDFSLRAWVPLSFGGAKDWLQFRMAPAFDYAFASAGYKTHEETSTNGAAAVVALTEAKNQSISNTARLTLDTAMEAKPENWPVGLMMGAKAGVGLVSTWTLSNAGHAGGAPAVATNETVAYNWNSDVQYRFGIFIPLQDGYRLDIVMGATTDITMPGTLTLQLIAPLGGKSSGAAKPATSSSASPAPVAAPATGGTTTTTPPKPKR